MDFNIHNLVAYQGVSVTVDQTLIPLLKDFLVCRRIFFDSSLLNYLAVARVSLKARDICKKHFNAQVRI